MKYVFLIVCFGLTVAQAHADIYKWTDKNGVIHYADSIEAVPSRYLKKVKVIPEVRPETTDDSKTIPMAAADDKKSDNGSGNTDINALKDRMMNDKEIMAIIQAMQNDKDIQAIVSDPAIMRSVEAGDVESLKKNPNFLKILNNPKVRQIIDKMNQ
jgi:hypothetical protein